LFFQFSLSDESQILLCSPLQIAHCYPDEPKLLLQLKCPLVLTYQGGELIINIRVKMEVNCMAHIISEECVACGTCAEECPAEAIKEGEPYVIEEDKCTDCGSCAEVCPVEAISQK
jgi:NAD-dependent dihydropyrimidine dehydrogenase PreA subunit